MFPGAQQDAARWRHPPFRGLSRCASRIALGARPERRKPDAINGADNGSSGARAGELAKTEDGEEIFVDASPLCGANMTDEFAQSACVDRADLFDEHSGWLAE